MGVGIAEIDEQTVTEQLGDMSIKALNDFRTSTLVRTDDFAILFGIELGGEFGGIHEVAEHHCELPTFRVRKRRGRRERFNLSGWLYLHNRLWCWLSRLRSHCLSVCRVARPHQHTILLIHRQFFGVDEFVFEALDIVVIDGETQFERPVGDTVLPLEQFRTWARISSK